MEDACGLAGNEVDNGLVVLELDGGPVYLLSCILLLFQPEHMLVEEELQRLVRIVDAQLLKTVCMEVLRTLEWQYF